MYYAHRKDGPVELRFDMIPDADGTARMQVYELFSNATDGEATLELERHWGLYMVTALAAELAEASNLNRGKVNGLRSELPGLLYKAKGYSHQRTGNQSMLVHNSGVRNFR